MKKLKIKIIRKTEDGPDQGEVFEAREITIPFMEGYQILTDGEWLGEFVRWINAVEVEE